MGHKAEKAIPSRGASNAFKGISKGTSTTVDKHGVSGTWKDYQTKASVPDSTIESSKIASSDAVTLQKRLAMGGKL